MLDPIYVVEIANKDMLWKKITCKGRFHEEVSDTSSSILSSHNSDDTYADASKTCLNGYSHHQNGCSNATIASANNGNGNANGNGTRGTLYMNGNGSLHNGR